MKKLLCLICVLFMANTTFADTVWINRSRDIFLDNNAIIWEVNVRNFAAKDTNNSGIIEENEESGNFINAINRLDELKRYSVNIIDLMPIMKLGKTNALGTAGSLYAPVSFNQLNPQLKSNKSKLSLEQQAEKFIQEAHKRNMHVIVDLPAFASYDLAISRPSLFLKNSRGSFTTYNDRKDVRVFDTNNREVYNLYKSFIDYVIMLGIDGIRAEMAYTKPSGMWKELIEYSHRMEPQFLWIAECPTTSNANSTSNYDNLLQAGFDGISGDYANLKDWHNAIDFMNYVKFTNSLRTKYSTEKSVFAEFASHNELSPALVSPIYSDMIVWLNATLPVNTIYADGFQTGDNYMYFWGNKRAKKTYTDDDTYYVERGKTDIYNFSRQPNGKILKLKEEMSMANGFKTYISTILKNGKFTELKTNNKSVFAYALTYKETTVITYGNLDLRNQVDTSIKVPHYNEDVLTVPIKMGTGPIASKNKFDVSLMPGEVQVMILNNFEL